MLIPGSHDKSERKAGRQDRDLWKQRSRLRKANSSLDDQITPPIVPMKLVTEFRNLVTFAIAVVMSSMRRMEPRISSLTDLRRLAAS